MGSLLCCRGGDFGVWMCKEEVRVMDVGSFFEKSMVVGVDD